MMVAVPVVVLFLIVLILPIVNRVQTNARLDALERHVRDVEEQE